MKAFLHSIILLSILTLFSPSAYSEDKIIRGSCTKVPGLFINNNPALYGFNPSRSTIAKCNAYAASMNAMLSYHRFRRMEAERIRLAWIHHKNYVDMERKYRREEYEAKLKAEKEEKERKAREKAEAEEAKYRTFTGKNGKTIEAKVVGVSPLVRKAKLKSRTGNTFEIALSNFSDEDVVYLKSHLN